MTCTNLTFVAHQTVSETEFSEGVPASKPLRQQSAGVNTQTVTGQVQTRRRYLTGLHDALEWVHLSIESRGPEHRETIY